MWSVCCLRCPGDGGGLRVGRGMAEQNRVRATNVPVVVVTVDGDGGRVWKWKLCLITINKWIIFDTFHSAVLLIVLQTDAV